MSQGFTLVYDPDVTTYRRVKITAPSAGTAILSGTVVDQSHSGSATVDVAVSTGSSVTSTIYGVTVETIYAGQTSVLIALITNRQVWSCEMSSATTSLAVIAAATMLTYIGLRVILGYIAVTSPTNLVAKDLEYLNNGVFTIPTGTTAQPTSVVGTGSDVTGTTGVFIVQGVLPAVSTSRIVGRFLYEHAA